MSYQKYGISQELVDRAKLKLKNPQIKERLKLVVDGVTKNDLQDRKKVKKLISLAGTALGEKLSDQQTENIAHFIIAQKIDPANTFHLIKLWGMFR